MDHNHHNMGHMGHNMPAEVTTTGPLHHHPSHVIGDGGNGYTAHEDHNMMGHDMMTMYFHTNIGSDYVLFKGWKPDTPGGQSLQTDCKHYQTFELI